MTNADIDSDDLQSAYKLLQDTVHGKRGVYSLNYDPVTVYAVLCAMLILTLNRRRRDFSFVNLVQEMIKDHPTLFADDEQPDEDAPSADRKRSRKAKWDRIIAETKHFCDSVAMALIESYPPPADGRRIFVIDSTNITIKPMSMLSEVIRSRTNKQGRSVPPVIMLTTAHELISGTALRPEFGIISDSERIFQAQQTETLASRIPPNSLLLADSDYGSFRVCYHCHREAGHDIHFRLTAARFKSMCKRAKLISSENGNERYKLEWTPLPSDRKDAPDLPVDAKLDVYVYSSIEPDGELMNLVSTVDCSPSAAAELYNQRFTRNENDIHDIRTALKLDRLYVESKKRLKQEILCKVAAYNLIVQLRRSAAERANEPPQRISFLRCFEIFGMYFQRRIYPKLQKWIKDYENAIDDSSYLKIPERRDR